MALLQALLERSNGVTAAQFLALDEVKKRLLLSELYEALARDPQIMPLLITAILRHKDDQGSTVKELFDTLATRARENFTKITQP